MPYEATGQLAIPWTGKSPRSRRSSHQGAVKAQERSLSQASRMMQQYATRGPHTDSEMARSLGLPEARISARRSALMQKGFVKYVSDTVSVCGVKVCIWGLTAAGQHVAGTLK